LATQASAMGSDVGARGPLYLWLLLGVHWGVGDVMLAGCALSVFGGVGCVVASTRMFGPWAGLWVLAQLGVLQASTTPGPLILAVMSLLFALYMAEEERGWSTGVWLGFALSLGHWTWPVALVIAWLSGRRLVALLSLIASLALMHVFGIALEPPSFGWVGDASFLMTALGSLMTDVVILPSVLALIWGLFRGNRATRVLMVVAAVHLLSVTLIDGISRDLLFSHVVIILGVAAVETGPALLVVALLLLGVRLPGVWDGTESEQALGSILKATASHPAEAMCTTTTYVRPAMEGGWLRPCQSVDTLGRPATEIHPEHVREAARALAFGLFVVEDRAILHTYPWLQDLLEEPYAPGFSVVAEAPGWRVFSVSP
jgi:hypothetical protein